MSWSVRVLQACSLIVVIDHIPKRLLRTIVKVRSCHQYVRMFGVLKEAISAPSW